ncbi:MAG: hypothetical protein HKN82_18530 [Akkermansiaceae bacterium]|nr:hypothetical protein [Akkermansiaceae bacterium]
MNDSQRTTPPPSASWTGDPPPPDTDRPANQPGAADPVQKRPGFFSPLSGLHMLRPEFRSSAEEGITG